MFIEPLDSDRHDRSTFSCGKPDLDEWLKKIAGQAERRGSARTFVLVEGDGPGVIGYYSLTAHAVAYGDAPTALIKRHPVGGVVPAILLSKLALDEEYQHRGLGKSLLADAVAKMVSAALYIGFHLIVVDAIDEEAKEFYEHFGFEPWPTDGSSMRLFARVKDIALSLGI